MRPVYTGEFFLQLSQGFNVLENVNEQICYESSHRNQSTWTFTASQFFHINQKSNRKSLLPLPIMENMRALL